MSTEKAKLYHSTPVGSTQPGEDSVKISRLALPIEGVDKQTPFFGGSPM